jgi:hypothetical protein
LPNVPGPPRRAAVRRGASRRDGGRRSGAAQGGSGVRHKLEGLQQPRMGSLVRGAPPSDRQRRRATGLGTHLRPQLSTTARAPHEVSRAGSQITASKPHRRLDQFTMRFSMWDARMRAYNTGNSIGSITGGGRRRCGRRRRAAAGALAARGACVRRVCQARAFLAACRYRLCAATVPELIPPSLVRGPRLGTALFYKVPLQGGKLCAHGHPAKLADTASRACIGGEGWRGGGGRCEGKQQASTTAHEGPAKGRRALGASVP